MTSRKCSTGRVRLTDRGKDLIATLLILLCVIGCFWAAWQGQHNKAERLHQESSHARMG